MQEDMHYYGTYAMARAAGLEIKQAAVVAYAAQYVDDSISNNSEQHDDGGMFNVTATAHTNFHAILNAKVDLLEQRKVWVPFHFYPGGEGESLSEKLRCTKDGKVANEMVRNHVNFALQSDFGLALLGIMAHVYADTFSHYGFSGVSSSVNHIVEGSIDCKVQSKEMGDYIGEKFENFLDKYADRSVISNWRKFASTVLGLSVGYLGHACAATYPDRPFLRWRFQYDKDDKKCEWRDNPTDFLLACEKIHSALSDYVKKKDSSKKIQPFAQIKDTVYSILSLEARKDQRIEAWRAAISDGKLYELDNNNDEVLEYNADIWEQQKNNFVKLKQSSEIIDNEIYQFHQAAIYHRDFTLKQLLPKHKIIVL